MNAIHIPQNKHFNHDQAFYYHLKEIDFDLFITFHFKDNIHSGTNPSSASNRRWLLQETFWNLTKALNIPQGSIQYFAVGEIGADGRTHCHVLVKKRKDVKLSNTDILCAVPMVVEKKYFKMSDLIVGEVLPRSLEIVSNSPDAVNYILKLRSGDEKKLGIKEDLYHSPRFWYKFEYLSRGCSNPW
jgi:hypothetical protein